jgi:hypothetical protein
MNKMSVSLLAFVVLLALPLSLGCGSSRDGSALGGLDLAGQLTSLLGQLTGSLGGITDLASAQAALPVLQSIDGGLGQILSQAAGAGPEVTGDLARIAGDALPDVNGLVDQVTGLAGVEDVLGSELGGITSKLAALAG